MRERWLRGECDVVVLGPKHLQEPAHLGERSGSGRLDRIERLVALAALGVPRTAGLEHDHADRVRNHVVQLSRDPRAFLGDGGARSFVALDDQLTFARAPSPHRPPGQPEAAEDDEEEDRVAELVEQRALVRVGDRAGEGDYRDHEQRAGDARRRPSVWAPTE